MEIDTFYLILENELGNIQHSYIRENEGMVYLGAPNINRNQFSGDDYNLWCYFLCFFVAFDLLIYTYSNNNYEEVKNKLKIPKFEYGLTNNFYYPEDLFIRLKVRLNEDVFASTFKQFIQFLDDQNFKFDFKEVLNEALLDKDFTKGEFSKYFKEEISQL